MEKYDADYQKLEIVNIGAADFFTSVTRDVDFTWIYYGWDGVAAEIKNFPINFMLLQNLDSQLDFYTPVIIVNEQTIKKNPDLIKRFLNATEKGYRFAIENPEKAAEILLADVAELDKEIVTASQKYLAGQYIADAPKWGEMKKEIWETFSNWMYGNNLLARQLKAEKAFSNEFLP
jgi:ABC-type nitrate/sulfonate/bicarbonate transport system substrate-binding protein